MLFQKLFSVCGPPNGPECPEACAARGEDDPRYGLLRRFGFEEHSYCVVGDSTRRKKRHHPTGIPRPTLSLLDAVRSDKTERR